MKERPILFSAPMVRALLAGSKTQTRRVVKPQPTGFVGGPGVTLCDRSPAPLVPMNDFAGTCGQEIICPYGQPGDRLWVRETWQGPLLQEFELDADADWHYASHIHQYQNSEHCEYAADGGPKPEYTDADDVMRQGWRPSIHMPRWASRITLEVTGVRVERLQDICFAAAAAEGLHYTSERLDRWSADGVSWHGTPQQAYRALWEQINGPGSWEENPWVWVVKFNRVIGGAP